MIKAAILAHPEEARVGLSRQAIKKYLHAKYPHTNEVSDQAFATNLSRAIASGSSDTKKTFVLPKGASGKVKLAPSAKPKPAKKPAAKKDDTKPAKAKKPATKKAAAPKKDTAKKPAAKKAAAPKKTTSTKKVRFASFRSVLTRRVVISYHHSTFFFFLTLPSHFCSGCPQGVSS